MSQTIGFKNFFGHTINLFEQRYFSFWQAFYFLMHIKKVNNVNNKFQWDSYFVTNVDKKIVRARKKNVRG